MPINDTDIAITTSGFEADIFESALYEGPGDVAEAGWWCQHVGRCHKPQFGPWNDLAVWANMQQPATRRFRDESLPLPTT